MKKYLPLLLLLSPAFSAGAASASARADTLAVSVPSVDTVVTVALVDTVAVSAPEPVQDSVEIASVRKDTLSAELLHRVDSLVEKGEGYTREYLFDLACDCFSQACSLLPDSLELRNRLMRSNSCREMVSSVSRPIVVERRRFGTDNFMLHYPMADKSWHPVDGEVPFYSRDDIDTIYVHRHSEERIYSMKCGDRLYFSSKDLGGMGGYDLFVCYRNYSTGEWDKPVNMGFPYSSPFDDYLFYDTEDGRFSLFASNRECPKDSVDIYVLQRDAPVEQVSGTPDVLKEMSSLKPEARHTVTKDPELSVKEKEAARLSDSMSALQREKNDLLQKLGKPEYQDRIIDLRQRIKAIDADLTDQMQELMRLGLEFQDEMEETREEDVNPGGFRFVRKTFGKKITVIYY